ncbi:MAG: DUF3570 domain-containing protein [Polyangiaceae bacterium]
MRLRTAAVCVAFALAFSPARALAAPSDLADERILDTSTLRVQSIDVSVTSFDQYGHGYQSQAGPVLGPGSERTTIFESQEQIVITHGDRLTYRFWIPVDIVTAASPNSIAPPDVQSGASRRVDSGSLDVSATYKANHALDLTMREGLHLEQPLRSWTSGLGFRRSYADEATVVSMNALEVFDWFDRFNIHGTHEGRTTRNATTGSVGFTQVLTPTTVANVNYGITVMEGTLGNTWNSVPLASGVRGAELLPSTRTRHALVARASQWLPWNGALRLYYRFYADDWGIVAHSMEAQLMQRLLPELYIGAYYRFHTQTGTYFFTTLAPVDWTLRVADSDLAPFDSQTVGGKVVVDWPIAGPVRAIHLELALESYVRTNDLRMDIVSWATGFRF